MNRAHIFLDTSALFSGIWSEQGAARMLLKLGEAAIVRLCVSSLVLTEIERVLRRKAPGSLGSLVLLIDRSGIRTTPDPSQSTLDMCRTLIPHPGDAAILAAALEADVDYFVTLDRKHFLHDRRRKEQVSIPLGTPGDCLAWLRSALIGMTSADR